MTTNLNALEIQLNKYIECIDKNTNLFKTTDRHKFILETNMTPCENLQIFKSGFKIETLSHEEICNLSWMLTKVLKAPLNYDNFTYWTWCGFVANFLKTQSNNISHTNNVFSDDDWVNAFNAILNILLTRPNNLPSPEDNYFLFRLDLKRFVIAGPLSYAVLEGLLRRRNSQYVDNEGKVIRYFKIWNNGNTKEFDLKANKRKRYNPTTEVNRIKFLVDLFENWTIPNYRNGRQCIGLDQLKKEAINIHPSQDFNEFIDQGRNNLIHGKEYWQTRVPVIMNLICLLLIDAIEPLDYNNMRKDFATYLKANVSSTSSSTLKSPLLENDIFYPPNI